MVGLYLLTYWIARVKWHINLLTSFLTIILGACSYYIIEFILIIPSKEEGFEIRPIFSKVFDFLVKVFDFKTWYDIEDFILFVKIIVFILIFIAVQKKIIPHSS